MALCGLGPSDIVLEIGAGRGELTGLIAKNVAKIYALEIDSGLCGPLRDTFKGCPNVAIINQDILKFNPGNYFAKIKKRIKIIGNIPYYISTPVIELLIKFRDAVDSIFITVQKEFALRMVAHPGSKEYGSFSCFVQYYLEPEIILHVKKTCFFPRPAVDSCFLKLGIKRRLPLAGAQEKLLFRIIRGSFNQRRKTLKNSLADIITREKLERFFLKSNIDNRLRPEELGLEDFIALTKA